MQYDRAEMCGVFFPEITLLNTKVRIIMEEDAAEQGTCSLYSWTVSKALHYICHGQRLLTALEDIYIFPLGNMLDYHNHSSVLVGQYFVTELFHMSAF